MLGKSITKNSLILGAFALVTATVLASTYLATDEKIVAQEKKAAAKALLEIVPAHRHTNNLLETTRTLPPAHLERLNLDEGEVHIARNNGEPVAAIIPAVAPDGYSGDIKLIVGVNADGSVAGVRVLSHRETPGLGDKVDLNKSDWVLSFNGKSLGEPPTGEWKVRKDGGQFDQFTGATITPRAVVRQVKNVLQYFNSHKDWLFGTQAQPDKPDN